jgi:hypothetical protein
MGLRARASLGWADAVRPYLFPLLQAVLDVVAVPSDVMPFTQLGVLARYKPPLGGLGVLGDRMMGAEVTDASLTMFLDELAQAVEDGTTPPSDAPSDAGDGHLVVAPANGIERLLLTVDGLSIRRGGAVGVWERLMAVPGVAHVSVDAWAGLVAVDRDPADCTAADLTAALENA